VSYSDGDDDGDGDDDDDDDDNDNDNDNGGDDAPYLTVPGSSLNLGKFLYGNSYIVMVIGDGDNADNCDYGDYDNVGDDIHSVISPCSTFRFVLQHSQIYLNIFCQPTERFTSIMH
jgi:hypothetical protein